MIENSIRKSFARGETIFREGDPGDCAYIIEHGAVKIVAGRGADGTVLARRGAGEIFGEMAMVDSKPRSASVVAAENCRLLVVSKQQLQARIDTLDPVLRMVLTVILGRFRDSVRQVSGEAASAETCPAPAVHPIVEFSSAFERIELEQTVKTALAREQFTLFYQPIVSAETGRIAGVEALARWNHPEHGLLTPGVFLSAIEDGGLMRPFSRWAVRRAARDAAAFANKAGDAPFFVSVNVTGDDICDPDFVEFVREAVAEADLRPSALELEVTESSLVADPDAAIEMLRALRALGVSISVDDFGTGYSNLTYLTRYPVQKLKVDRSFVMKLSASEEDAQVVSAIVRLCHAIGLTVVAEGVEEAAQIAMLKEYGCDLLQGFYYSRPVSFDAALEKLGGAGENCSSAA